VDESGEFFTQCTGKFKLSKNGEFKFIGTVTKKLSAFTPLIFLGGKLSGGGGGG